MTTCIGHFTAGGSIKFRDNRWVEVHNNRKRRTCHLTAGEAIKLIVNRRMGIHNNRRRHTSSSFALSVSTSFNRDHRCPAPPLPD
ncbi:hypothetical protein TNCV_4802741 [Trichonephila clavipes]|nr:hypothetical protein TNCV_4802741 [Trichonephila clavipes]